MSARIALGFSGRAASLRALALALLFATSSASADPPTLLTSPLGLGEPTGSSPSFAWSTPMRLSLTGGIFPVASQFPNCESREDAAGNSVGGIAVQRFTLLRLTPNLVLTGFSRLGCPIDSAIGGAASYAMGLSSKSWLVLSSGIYGAPALPAAMVSRGSAKTLAGFHADYVWQTAKGSTRSLGLGTTAAVGVGGSGSHNMITFGGAF